MVISDWKNYYVGKEIREILGWDFAEYEKRRRSDGVPPYKTVGGRNKKIFPKKEFWRWAASKEVAHEIIPEKMSDVYKTERYLYLRDLLDDEEAKRRIYS